MLARRSSGTVGSSNVDRLDASGQSHEERSSGPQDTGITPEPDRLWELPRIRDSAPSARESRSCRLPPAFVFFDLKPRREEAWLIERFSAYGAYRERPEGSFPGSTDGRSHPWAQPPAKDGRSLSRRRAVHRPPCGAHRRI